MKCVNCGVENSETAKFCKSCGSKLEVVMPSVTPAEAKKFCPQCGQQASAQANFCRSCGYKFEELGAADTYQEPASAPEPKPEPELNPATPGQELHPAASESEPVQAAETNEAVVQPEMSESADISDPNMDTQPIDMTEEEPAADNSTTPFAQAVQNIKSSANEQWEAYKNGASDRAGGTGMSRDNIPAEYALTSPIGYVGYILLFTCIPIVSFILTIVYGFGSSSNTVHVKNLAKAFFYINIFGYIIGILWIIIAACTAASIVNSYY